MYCFVLHMGINVYFTNNRETHRSCACFQRANTRSGRMFGRVCMLKVSTGLVCLFAICITFIYYIPICNTKLYIYQKNMLSFVILVLIIMYTLVSGVHVCNKVIKMVSLHQARLAQSVERQTLNRRVVGSSPTVAKTFFILYFVASDALLAGRLAPCKWNQAWRPSELYMCIERERKLILKAAK